MKKLFALLLAVVMVLSLAACGGNSAPAATEAPKSDAPAAEAPAADTSDVANDPKVTLVYAEVNPEDTIVGKTAAEFKRLVEELSGGSITIDVRYSGVLGSENDVLDAIIGGDDSIDMSRISAFALTSYGAKKSMLLSIPYTFVSRDHWWNFANSDLATEFLNEPQEIGLPLRGIFYGEEGFRHFFANVPLTDITSLKGLKIRVSNDPSFFVLKLCRKHKKRTAQARRNRLLCCPQLCDSGRILKLRILKIRISYQFKNYLSISSSFR